MPPERVGPPRVGSPGAGLAGGAALRMPRSSRPAHHSVIQAALDRSRPLAGQATNKAPNQATNKAPNRAASQTAIRAVAPDGGALTQNAPALGKPALGKPAPGGPAGQPAPFEALFQAAARREGIDPALLRAVAETESSFNPQAVSAAGAKGLMQLMDATAKSLGVADAFDPAQNIAGGAKYLKQLLQRYSGDAPKAVAAYNAGPGTVDQYGGIPPYAETQNYVQRVLGRLRPGRS